MISAETACLWLSARTMLLHLLFVAGIDKLAAIALLSARQLRIVRSWIAPLEVMARKLLLIEAAALSPANAPARKPTAAKTKPAQRRSPAFVVIPAVARPTRAPQRIRSLGAPLLARDAWREAQRSALIARLRQAPRPARTAQLANRIRALASVIQNPAPHARRLARLLRRSARATMAMDCIAYARVPNAPRGFAHVDFDRASVDVCSIDRAPLLTGRR